jgi:small-conductance mechanosensitive channel
LFQLAALLTKIVKLTESLEAKKDKRSRRWLETILEYRRATLKQILHEAAIVYPQVQYRLIPARQLKEKAERVEAEVSLFTRLNSSFKAKGARSHQFAYHLVSLFFSSKKQIVLGKLEPTPVTVRRNIEAWKKRPTTQVSGKIRKATI